MVASKQGKSKCLTCGEKGGNKFELPRQFPAAPTEGRPMKREQC